MTDIRKSIARTVVAGTVIGATALTGPPAVHAGSGPAAAYGLRASSPTKVW